MPPDHPSGRPPKFHGERDNLAPEVAVTLYNLGDVLEELGDLDGARQQYERALAIEQASLGPDRPRT
jgi:tetratricopeptide (TPR) repeat protein